MITLTPEQIDAGRKAAMKRDKKWKPTPPSAIALAHRLWGERRRFRETVECVAVAKTAGTSSTGIRSRYLTGELGLPTPNCQRAVAFANGQNTYTRADGTVRLVGDDRGYQNDRYSWWWDRARESFDGMTIDRVEDLWVDQCPCCGIGLRSAGVMSSPSLDHLVPDVRHHDNARILCKSCNAIKQDALPWMIHKVADWMTLTPAAMIERAMALPEMPLRMTRAGDRRKEMLRGKRANNAEAYDVEFTLTLEDVVWSASCPVFGVPFLLPGSEDRRTRYGTKRGPTWDSPSFDRIDPRRGYVPGNVVLVCTLANRIMQDATSPDRVRMVAEWFDRELAAAPELAALIKDDTTRAHWAMAAE